MTIVSFARIYAEESDSGRVTQFQKSERNLIKPRVRNRPLVNSTRHCVRTHWIAHGVLLYKMHRAMSRNDFPYQISFSGSICNLKASRTARSWISSASAIDYPRVYEKPAVIENVELERRNARCTTKWKLYSAPKIFANRCNNYFVPQNGSW